MSLVLDFDVLSTNIPTAVNLFDTTGTTSSTGWGVGGNPIPSDATAATLTILPYLSTATPFIVNVLNGTIPFPNDEGDPFVILNTDLGLSGSAPILSGIYTMTYVVTAGSPYATFKNIYLDYQHRCCCDKILAQAVAPGCANRLDLQTLAINLRNMIDSVHAMLQPNCNEVDSANDIVKQINAICAAQGWANGGCGCNQ